MGNVDESEKPKSVEVKIIIPVGINTAPIDKADEVRDTKTVEINSMEKETKKAPEGDKVDDVE